MTMMFFNSICLLSFKKLLLVLEFFPKKETLYGLFLFLEVNRNMFGRERKAGVVELLCARVLGAENSGFVHEFESLFNTFRFFKSVGYAQLAAASLL